MTPIAVALWALAWITTLVIAFFVGDGIGYERGRFARHSDDDDRSDP